MTQPTTKPKLPPAQVIKPSNLRLPLRNVRHSVAFLRRKP